LFCFSVTALSGENEVGIGDSGAGIRDLAVDFHDLCAGLFSATLKTHF